MSRANFLLKQASQDHDPGRKAHRASVAKRLREALFKQQRDFVDDPARFKAALCPRRAGKSYTALSAALITALERPRSKTLVIAKVRRQAYGVYWSDLKRLCSEYELNARFHKNELSCEFPDGSGIYLTGADTAEEIDKFRGQSYDLVIIDEGKSYSASLLEELVYEVIRPALSDRLGKIMMIGTPGAILAGLFYQVTTASLTDDKGNPVVSRYSEREQWTGKKALWSLHSWTTKDNVKQPQIWRDVLELKEQTGWSDNHPTWVREYLGQWVPDSDAMVYAYAHANQDGRCDWEPDFSEKDFGLPEGHDWRYLLGVDLGWHDDTAFIIAAWSEHSPSLYFVYAEKHKKLTVEALAGVVKDLESRFGIEFDVRIADTGGLGKTIVESLASTYGISLISARKTDKHDHIKLLNSDMETGRIKVAPRSALAEEWSTLQWQNNDPVMTGFRRREDPSMDNHASDAALYLWRYAYHHLSTEQQKALTPGSEEWWAQRAKDEFKQAVAEEAAEGEPFWESYAGEAWTSTSYRNW